MSAAPPPQLPYNSAPYLPNAIPKVPKTPHLWQQALASFLGNTANAAGKNVVDSAMSPKTTLDPKTNQVAFNAKQPWYATAPTVGQTTGVSGSNAMTNEAASRAALARAEAEQTTKLTPATLQKMLADAGYTRAQEDRTKILTPVEKGKGIADIGETQARTGLLGTENINAAAQTPFIAPRAQADIAHENAGTDYTKMLNQFMPQQIQSSVGTEIARRALLNTQAQLTGQEAQRSALGSMFQQGNMGQMKDAKGQPMFNPEEINKLLQGFQGTPSPLMPNPAWGANSGGGAAVPNPQ